jgi:transcriptional regulator with XRE-family HTH domain
VDEVTIGARLRILRRWRGMSQVELAGLSDLSPSFISMVETGQRPLDRRSHIAAVASALRVSETDLVGGPHLTPDPLQSDPHMSIPALRVALQTNTLTTPAVDYARPLPEVVQEVQQQIEPMRRACDYVGCGRLLPGVLDELYYHVAAPADEAAQQLALQTLIVGCLCATFAAKDLNYMDLAGLAAVRAQEAATLLEDPAYKGQADFAWLHTLPRSASGTRNLIAAERAANQLEPHHSRSPVGTQVLGMLTLTASLTAAALYQGDTARHWFHEAEQIASTVPDEPMTNWQSFSQTNVNVWRVTVGVERGESGGAVLELGEDVNLGLLSPVAARYAGFLVDGGRGLAREARTMPTAIRWLRQAEEAAPQRVRNSATARDTVAYLLNRARADAGGRELRGLAARMGLPH